MTVWAFKTATPRKDWAKVGDEVLSPMGMIGVVQKITHANKSLPDAHVRWSNGHSGRIAITNIRKVK